VVAWLLMGDKKLLSIKQNHNDPDVKSKHARVNIVTGVLIFSTTVDNQYQMRPGFTIHFAHNLQPWPIIEINSQYPSFLAFCAQSG